MQEHWKRIGIAASVVVLLIAGALLAFVQLRNGGVYIDVTARRTVGLSVCNYILSGDRSLTEGVSRSHGVFWETVLATIEVCSNMVDWRARYIMRNAGTFMIYLAGLFFLYQLAKYLSLLWASASGNSDGFQGSFLCALRAESRVFPVLVCVFFVLSPRVLGHAFVNAKDIPFMTGVIVAIYSLLRFLEVKNVPRACVHALVCGILAATRMVGIVFILVTVVCYFFDAIFANSEDRCKTFWRTFFVYFGAVTVATIVCNPLLWRHPLLNVFWGFFDSMTYQPLSPEHDLTGAATEFSKTDKGYVVSWIVMTTPLLYCVLSVVGVVAVSGSMIRVWTLKRKTIFRTLGLVLMWFLGPLTVASTGMVNIYCGWRHLFFIYPAFIVIASVGAMRIWLWIKMLGGSRTKNVAKHAVVFILAVSICLTVWDIIRYRPYQMLYVSRFARTFFGENAGLYSSDYWGLANYEALSFLVQRDRAEQVPIWVPYYSGVVNGQFLPSAERARLAYVSPAYARYILVPHDGLLPNQEGYRQVYVVQGFVGPILTVYENTRALPIDNEAAVFLLGEHDFDWKTYTKISKGTV